MKHSRVRGTKMLAIPSKKDKARNPRKAKHKKKFEI